MTHFLITGANAGIGLAISTTLARTGGHVTMMCRDLARSAPAFASVREAAPDARRVQMIRGDLGTVADAEEAATTALDACPQLDVLIQNAGIWPTQLHLNAEGMEQSFAVNHLSAFVLAQHLLPRLRASDDGRLVQVTAGLYPLGTIRLEQTPTGADFSPMKTYANTKLWNLLATLELARREQSAVAILAVHPGVIRTGLGDGRHWSAPLLRLVKRFWGKPLDGAKAPVYLATAPDLGGVQGAYFDEMRRTDLKPVARDLTLATDVWVQTEALLAQIRQSGGDGPTRDQ